jgi:hypothetical protein
MTAALQTPVRQGVLSLEVRWIVPGELDGALIGWFGQSGHEVESRRDAYLLRHDMTGLSVKIRGGAALEVKAYRGSPGALALPGRACGRLESWQKWSFPFPPAGLNSHDLAGWRTVDKQRLIRRPATAVGPGCAVELTQILVQGQPWWSLGFEATGPAGLLRAELEATAAAVFARALPGGAELGMSRCRSYAQWLQPAWRRRDRTEYRRG